MDRHNMVVCCLQFYYLVKNLTYSSIIGLPTIEPTTNVLFKAKIGLFSLYPSKFCEYIELRKILNVPDNSAKLDFS